MKQRILKKRFHKEIQKEMEASNAGSYELVAAVLRQAVKDMHYKGSPSSKERLDAILFLGSTRAALWLDFAGLDQKSTLIALKWDIHAKALLDNPKTRITDTQYRVLNKGINALQSLESTNR